MELSGPAGKICNDTAAGPSNLLTMAIGVETIDDAVLLRRMMAGDEDSFTLLYRRKHPGIYRFALHMSGNAAIAEDVTQEVFMTLIRDGKRFDIERGTVVSFLFGVARNQVRKRWEQNRRLVALPDEPDNSGSGVREGSYENIDA